MSTVFDIFNRSTPPPQQIQNQHPTPNFINQLQQFASTIPSNPEQMVRNMLANGQMTREQFAQLGRQASQIQQSLRRR